MSKKKDIATTLLGVVVALILWLTILSREKLIGTPIVHKPFHEFISLFESIRRDGVTGNFLGNILIFIPIGLLLPLATGKMKWYRTIGTGFCFSLFIEITQLIAGCGCFDPDDMILNTLGTVIGYGLWIAAETLIIHKNIIGAKSH